MLLTERQLRIPIRNQTQLIVTIVVDPGRIKLHRLVSNCFSSNVLDIVMVPGTRDTKVIVNFGA